MNLNVFKWDFLAYALGLRQDIIGVFIDNGNMEAYSLLIRCISISNEVIS